MITRDQAHIRELVWQTLEMGYVMSLATVDNGGPWVSDVVYVADEKLNLYWLSQTLTRHSLAIAGDNRVAATITISKQSGEPNQGLQIAGIGEKIEGDMLEIAIKNCLKRGNPAPTRAGEVFMPGQSWYRLTPNLIELIYEPEFGRTKQKLLC